VAGLGIEDAARIAASLPGVTEGLRHGHRTWFVAGKAFAWERPFSKADIKRFGVVAPPDGPIFAVSTGGLEAKEFALMAHPGELFTIAHFDGYPAVLIHMNSVSRMTLENTIVDGWLACAPPDLARQLPAR
jgi:hypothetical protein